jgi:hypothetical protein
MKKLELVKKQLKDAMLTEVKLKKLEKVNLMEKPIKNGLEFAQDTKRAMRTIISMYPELNKKKHEIVDEDVEYLAKKIIKNEKLRLLYQNKHIVAKDVEGKQPKEVSKIENEKLTELDESLSSIYIVILEGFLPQMITKEEIVEFIKNNIDFSQLKNKMQAIGIIKNHFGNTVDANLVRDILLKWN